MEATIATAVSMVGFFLVAMAPVVSDPVREFGENLWTLVIVLDVINTVFVLFYLWRIWTRKELPVPRRTRNQGI